MDLLYSGISPTCKFMLTVLERVYRINAYTFET